MFGNAGKVPSILFWHSKLFKLIGKVGIDTKLLEAQFKIPNEFGKVGKEGNWSLWQNKIANAPGNAGSAPIGFELQFNSINELRVLCGGC